MGGALDASLRSCVPEPLRILLVDDFGPFREALRVLLGSCADFAVVGEAVDGQSAIEMACQLDPQVIVMDVEMPGMGGVEATRRIKRVHPSIHIIGVSSQDDTITKEAMKAVGSSVFITKECAHTLPNVIAEITDSARTYDNVS